MDQAKRAALIVKIKAIAAAEGSNQEAVVAVEDFFDGNDDLGSIGANLPSHPGLDRFREVFLSVRSRPEVAELVVAIWELDDRPNGDWPYAEKVYLATIAGDEAVEDWFAPLEPDEIWEVQADTLRPSPHLDPGYRLLAVWWD
ncbi:MAG: hypothetical protein ACFB13_02775 [Kiloniellaceae bacterium]